MFRTSHPWEIFFISSVLKRFEFYFEFWVFHETFPVESGVNRKRREWKTQKSIKRTARSLFKTVEMWKCTDVKKNDENCAESRNLFPFYALKSHFLEESHRRLEFCDSSRHSWKKKLILSNKSGSDDAKR